MQEAPASDHLSALSLSPHEHAFYGSEARIVAPDSYEELETIVRDAERERRHMIPAGLGAHAYLGNPPPGNVLVVSLRKLNRILRYEPGDFTVGVETGLTLSELRATLEANGQEIPLDLPSAARGTVGGLVAAAPSGLRRGRHGPVRAYVIGAHALRGGATRYKTGGMVVKNVAGYEVMKFLTGSLGTAGPIVEVNFKLRPLPERRAAHVAVFQDPDAAWRFADNLRSRGREPAAIWVLNDEARRQAPRMLESLNGDGVAVFWLFEGQSGRVAWQESQAGSILDEQAPSRHSAVSGSELDLLIDFLADFDSPGAGPRVDLAIAKLSALPNQIRHVQDEAQRVVLEAELAPATACDVLSGLVTLRWSPRRDATEANGLDRPIADLGRTLLAQQGTGTLLYLPPQVRQSHNYLLTPDANASLARRLLKVFDPNSVFCPEKLLGPGP